MGKLRDRMLVDLQLRGAKHYGAFHPKRCSTSFWIVLRMNGVLTCGSVRKSVRLIPIKRAHPFQDRRASPWLCPGSGPHDLSF